ncbi:hypothetical protein VPNG_01426 [Cytospora leucostoma]|uniref:NACHT domain-containing protein n=1 Tax=Cytospora leucostoma TaxID=1230097 RepID=A0A423XKN1_9PEZI|nr:hypothetical protein VPNG_01426 [Cytospora leucostoma]
MDPLSAIGLASNVLAFISFSTGLLKTAKNIHDSSNGTLDENRSRETVVREMKHLSTRLLIPGATGCPDGNTTLQALAQECQDIATQLISLLERIKPKEPKSISQSIWAALRNQIYEKDREDLEVRLANCRSQLELQLNFLSRKETLEKLQDLLAASKMNESKLDEIHSQVTQLRRCIQASFIEPDARAPLKLLLSTEERVFESIAEERILRCLSFEGMNRREDMVVETHSNTFKWILEDDETDEIASTAAQGQDDRGDSPDLSCRFPVEDEKQVRAREKLGSWLASGNIREVFHLSGKLGSGKSTLIKFISESHHTAERLDQWADGRKLTIVSFYFWNAGSEYEKSLRGLYRGLLHRILKDCPDLMATVLPLQYEQAISAPWLAPKAIEISEREVLSALAQIINSYHLWKSNCFCLFIDGLDEFQPTTKDDYRDLVNLLCRWAWNAPKNVKICVSSREYPIFMERFSANSRIRLHELTRNDMEVYIRDRLADAREDDGLELLVFSIMNKANGVFLWVALVIKSMREGLEMGTSCADLTNDVDMLPDQLEDLYRYILTSLGKIPRKRAYQTFAMIVELKKYENYRMSLLAYSFLESYDRGEHFFTKKDGAFPKSDLEGDSGKKRSKNIKKRLAGWCKGLVEPYGETYDAYGRPGKIHAANWDNWEAFLDFTHRSVLDFLRAEDVKCEMDSNLHDFDTIDAISNLLIADALFDNNMPYGSSRISLTINTLMQVRGIHKLDRQLLELFLRFEPDLHISFHLFVDPEPMNETKFIFDLEGRCITVKVLLKMDTIVKHNIVRRVGEDKDDRNSSTKTDTSSRKDYRFRDFIELLPLDNKERILGMIDEQLSRGVRNGPRSN